MKLLGIEAITAGRPHFPTFLAGRSIFQATVRKFQPFEPPHCSGKEYIGVLVILGNVKKTFYGDSFEEVGALVDQEAGRLARELLELAQLGAPGDRDVIPSPFSAPVYGGA